MNRNINNNKEIINTTRFVNIRELTPEEIQEVFNQYGSWNKSAPVCRCSPKTFKKYYEKAKIIQTVAKKSETKSMLSDIFLDPEQSRVALLDIEATGLRGDFGVILCVVIKEFSRNNTKLFKIDLEAEDLLESEKQMLIHVNEYLKTFDGVIGYYSSRYDIPMLRTRSYYHGIEPLPKIRSLDTYFTVKRVINTSSRRLERVSDLMRINANKELPEKSKIDINEWIRVLHSRDEQSLRYICEHCIADVLVLEGVTNELRPFLPERIMRA